MNSSLMLGAALGAPELASGFTKAGKNMKTVNKKANPYDQKLNPGTQGLQLSADSVAEQEKISNICCSLMEKMAKEDKPRDGAYYLKTYGIPASVAAIAVARGKKTGNYLQFPFYDAAHLFKKTAPGVTDSFITMQAKNPALRGWGKRSAQILAKSNQAAAKNPARSTIGHSLVSGAGWMGGGILIEDVADKSKQNKQNKTASYIEKEAVEVPNTKLNHVRKWVREGVLHPGVKAFPIYIAPAALGYALNKDIKSGDFAPVRDMTKAQKDKKNETNRSQTDFASFNNAAINNQLLTMASFDDGFEKIAKLKVKIPKNVKRYMKDNKVFVKPERRETISIKDWGALPEDAAIAGLGATSMMIPIAIMSKSDPVQKVKAQIRNDAAYRQQKQLEHDQKKAISKAIKKEVKKEVKKTGV